MNEHSQQDSFYAKQFTEHLSRMDEIYKNILLPNKEYLTIKEVADSLEFKESTVRGWIKKYNIPRYRNSKNLIGVNRDELFIYLTNNRVRFIRPFKIWEEMLNNYFTSNM